MREIEEHDTPLVYYPRFIGPDVVLLCSAGIRYMRRASDMPGRAEYPIMITITTTTNNNNNNNDNTCYFYYYY